MQKLIETLQSFGIEIPEDKQSEVKTALSKYYKNVNEHNKAFSKLEAERDTWKDKAETAETTLKSFEGIDPENIQKELDDYKKRAEDAEKNAQAEIYKRDFADALKAELDNIHFTSESAKRAVMADIEKEGLKLKDGKILGLSDLISQIKEKDASAFVDEEQEELEGGKARFTNPVSKLPKPGTKVTPSELMRLKNENPNLDISKYM